MKMTKALLDSWWDHFASLEEEAAISLTWGMAVESISAGNWEQEPTRVISHSFFGEVPELEGAPFCLRFRSFRTSHLGPLENLLIWPWTDLVVWTVRPSSVSYVKKKTNSTRNSMNQLFLLIVDASWFFSLEFLCIYFSYLIRKW